MNELIKCLTYQDNSHRKRVDINGLHKQPRKELTDVAIHLLTNSDYV